MAINKKLLAKICFILLPEMKEQNTEEAINIASVIYLMVKKEFTKLEPEEEETIKELDEELENQILELIHKEGEKNGIISD